MLSDSTLLKLLRLPYSAGLSLYGLLIIPKYFKRISRSGFIRKGLRERMGYLVLDTLSRAGRKCLWIHAVSVGETLAAGILIDKLRRERPDLFIVLSTTTETGYEVALNRSLAVDGLFYFPFDLTSFCKRSLRTVKPDLVVLIETELWPNFLLSMAEFKIPVLLVNGRLSEKSFKRYQILNKIMPALLSVFSTLAVQTESDAERFIKLGAPEKKVKIIGNIKFDLSSEDLPAPPEDLKNFIKADKIIWVAGSTHAGEEEIILDAYQNLIEKKLEILLILAPRHPERISDVEALILKRNLSFARRSQISVKNLKLPNVILIDTMGELFSIYSLADLVFVGGSLVPVGGHNLLEPAVFGKPIIFGPYLHNFKAIKEEFLKGQAGLMVSDRNSLIQSLSELCENPEKRLLLGNKARDIVIKNKGVTKKILEEIKTYI